LSPTPLTPEWGEEESIPLLTVYLNNLPEIVKKAGLAVVPEALTPSGS
jgi:hypothetical protein